MEARTVALLCLGFSIACVCCKRGAPGYYGTTEPLHGPDEIWTNMGTEPEWIDPGKAADTVSGFIVFNLFAGLTQPHPLTLDPMPDVAESWEISPDGMHYTFHLRESVWSDGTPLTAADFVYAWTRALDPSTASKYGDFLYPVRYAELWNRRALVVRNLGDVSEPTLRAALEPLGPLELVRLAPELDAAFVIVGGEEGARPALRERMQRALDGKALQLNGRLLAVAPMDASLVGVHAADERTLLVDLEAPLPYFLHITKFYTAMPVPRHVLERLAKAGKNTDLWTRPENIVSNGPFVLADAQFRQSMLLRKNPRYWDAAHVRLERVRVREIESYNTALNMYKAGELDAIGPTGALPNEFIDALSTQKDFHIAPWNGVYFYWFNASAPPLDDPRVRNALRFAIDRQTLVKHITRAGQIPSADLVPPGLAGYPGIGSSIYDPDRARALLREAGYGPEHPLPKITLIYNTSESHRSLAEAVQAMWHEQLGIEVEIENQEWKVYLKSVQTKSFQIARMSWIGDYPDPYTFLDLLTTHSGNNHSNWHSDAYDELLARANREADPPRRLQLLAQAERLAMAQAPILPLYVYTRAELWKPYVMGHAINYETRHLLKYWWIDRRWYGGVPAERLADGFPPQPLAAILPARVH
jgi:oligopeptide transport system substrate-binding protein